MAAMAVAVHPRRYGGRPAPGARAAPRHVPDRDRQAGVVRGRQHLRLVGDGPPVLGPVVHGAAGRADAGAGARSRSARFRATRVLPGMLTVVALLGVWFGAGALVGGGSPLVPPAGSRPTASGYAYVARPGDTAWSIASAMEPGRDPRPLMDSIDAQLRGGVLRVGETIHLP